MVLPCNLSCGFYLDTFKALGVKEHPLTLRQPRLLLTSLTRLGYGGKYYKFYHKKAQIPYLGSQGRNCCDQQQQSYTAPHRVCRWYDATKGSVSADCVGGLVGRERTVHRRRLPLSDAERWRSCPAARSRITWPASCGINAHAQRHALSPRHAESFIRYEKFEKEKKKERKLFHTYHEHKSYIVSFCKTFIIMTWRQLNPFQHKKTDKSVNKI